MSDIQTQIAADNCEVLRARLAQYEDAEGRPLQPAADLARRIDQAITVFTSGRACMHVPPFDTDVDIVLSECLKIANALESQAREIERLGAELENTLVSWGQVRLELAAIKAHPGGVVLYTCVGKGGEYEYIGLSDGAGMSKGEQREVYRCTSTGRVFHRECMDFSARMERLNSSPVSAGGADERAAFEAHMRLGGYSNTDKHPDGSYVSSAMELWWQGWKARASLSAPSHGEQVRASVPELSASELESLLDFHRAICCESGHTLSKGQIGRLVEVGAIQSHGFGKHSLTEFGVYLLAAAPSAGSHKEQGE